ncbi:MAG: putative glutamine amidotransferase [Chthoniobacter sp.]|nr:putative glutamine amidotransferase [Chthoniobacter sp.]
MQRLATWLRETDRENFGRFFARHPGLQVFDARINAFDLADMDGLLITGGPDISAEFHPEPPRDPSLIEEPEPLRDAWEFGAVRAAYERGLPVLCVCKGLQVLNLALGGTLHLDIPGHRPPEMKYGNLQPLRYETSARHRFAHVNSSHHQALDRVAEPLEVEAWHAEDGVIEQVRLRDYSWGVGVQYHPERDLAYAPLFDDFFAQSPS